MGITINSIECLLSQRHELDFSSTVMLGHQQFFDAQESRYRELAVRFGLPAHQPDDIGFKGAMLMTGSGSSVPNGSRSSMRVTMKVRR